jgi:hypothetical protein
MAHVLHAPPRGQPSNRLKQENPWETTLHGYDTKRAHTRGQNEKSTLERGNHAPITAEHPGRRRQRLDQRKKMSMERGSVSPGVLWNSVDLASKDEKIETQPKLLPTTETAESPPPTPHWDVFLSTKETKN